MNVGSPGSTLAGGLLMPILRVLSRRGDPVTAADVRIRAGVGTPAGVRRALERLAASGLVDSAPVGRVTVYTLNRDHVLIPAVQALLDADTALQARLREHLARWPFAPVTALLYGSAGRRDGDEDSDIDVLLVHGRLSEESADAWDDQVAGLRESTERWTGNRAHVLTRDVKELRRLAHDKEPIVQRWREEGVLLAGTALGDVIGARS